jgi:hypothetical protein
MASEVDGPKRLLIRQGGGERRPLTSLSIYFFFKQIFYFEYLTSYVASAIEPTVAW